jgi:hypothetical protein
LPGQGKPLPQEPWQGDWALVHHVLKQAGETLPWISLGRDIEAAQAKLRGLLDDASMITDAGERGRARERYVREAATLDKLLVEYAFVVPIRQLERGRLPPHVAAAQFDRACATRSG